jgi:hypothetical protein
MSICKHLFQLTFFTAWMSFITLSLRLILGRPTDLEAVNFHVYILLMSVSSGIHSTWHNHLNLWALMESILLTVRAESPRATLWCLADIWGLLAIATHIVSKFSGVLTVLALPPLLIVLWPVVFKLLAQTEMAFLLGTGAWGGRWKCRRNSRCARM